MRVAINLLTDDPAHPSGAHWFWTRVIPEMAARLADGEELHLLVSPKSRPDASGLRRPTSDYITFPWSNESPPKRTAERAPLRAGAPAARADRRLQHARWRRSSDPRPALVVHFKTMHAFTAPEAIRPTVRLYRRMSYPRTAKVADAIIINSESLRREVMRYLDVDPAKLRLIPEAVDHELFRPGDADEARAARQPSATASREPFVLFVSSLWPYKNCEGLLRAFAAAKSELGDRQLVVVGPGRDVEYVAELQALAEQLGIADDVVWVGGVPLEETVQFYRARGRLRVPVLQRDLRPADPRGDGDGLPRRHLGHERDAGDRRRLRAARGPARPRVDRRRHRQGLRAGGGAAACVGPGAGGRVHLGRDRRTDARRVPRGPSAARRGGGRR